MAPQALPRINGHRGAAKREPENTMRSFLRAQADGADEVELDVHLARTGELVVIHDHTLDRTTNGTGLVADHDFAGLRALDAGDGEHIPTMEEVIDAVTINVQVEVKAVAAAAAIAAVAAQRPEWAERVTLISFHREVLEAFQATIPQYRRGFLTETFTDAQLATCLAVGAHAIYANWATVDADAVARARALGLGVVVWTANDEAQWHAAVAAGVDGVTTDVPGDFVALRALAEQVRI